MNRRLELVLVKDGLQYSKLKDNYHTQGTQWVENNFGLMVLLHSTVIQILRKENLTE